MATHIARRDLIRTTWLQALAYAASARRKVARKHPRVWAVATFPSLLFVHCVLGHRNLYLTSTREGVVCLYRNPPWGVFARGAVCAVLLYGVSLIDSPCAVAALGAVALIFVGSMFASFFVMGRRSKAPTGTAKIKKPRDHYVIGLIAAHPDASPSETLLFGRGLVCQLPEGSAVVVHPRTAKLRTFYERLGFSPSRGLEMVARVSGEPGDLHC